MVKTAVLLTAFGAPGSMDQVQPFMCDLMGREPSDELVGRICKRYLAIGGGSPLPTVAAEIARMLEAALAEAGAPVPVVVGMRYSDPRIEDALAAMKEAGIERVVTLSLSPFESKVTHGAYREAIDKAVEVLGGMEVVEAPLISELPEYANFYAMSAATAISDMPESESAILVFSAHSLPESDLVEDDPYVQGLRGVADEVVTTLGLSPGEVIDVPLLAGRPVFGSFEPPRAWLLAYQSKGDRPGAWLGPDLDEVVDVAVQSQTPGLVVVPIGFMTDHLETLYDIDIEAAGKAYDADLAFARAECPNADEDLLTAVAKELVPIIRQ